MQGPPQDEGDAFAALAQLKARRAMADLAGFAHHPSWDQQERVALERLRVAKIAQPTDDVAEPPAERDLLADFARVAARRFAVDSMGMQHDPAWDREEAEVARQLRQSAEPDA